MNNFEKASQNLMEKVNEGKKSVLEYKGETKDKYEELFERLENIDLSPENMRIQRKRILVEFVEELKKVINGETHKSTKELNHLITKLEINRQNLKHILDNNDDIKKYDIILLNLKK